MNVQSTLKVLLVEDNLVNQKITLYQLKSLGYIADVASGKQAAIEKVLANHYDVILMNSQLPDGDGCSTAQAIRQLEASLQQTRRSPLVIIAMEADLTPTTQAQGLAAGINHYLSKPIRKEELAQELQVWQQRILSNLNNAEGDLTNTGLVSQGASKDSLNEVIDWSHLQQMSDGNQEFELELLKIFVEDTQQHLQAAKTAIDSENFWQLEQEAHHIKGASANVGIKKMQTAAAQLEQNARNFQMTGAAELIAEIAAPLSRVVDFIANK